MITGIARLQVHIATQHNTTQHNTTQHTGGGSVPTHKDNKKLRCVAGLLILKKDV